MNKSIRPLHPAARAISLPVVALAALLLASCSLGDTRLRPSKIIHVDNGEPTSVAFSLDGKTLVVGARAFITSTNKWSSELHIWSTDSWFSLPTLTLGEGVMDGGVGIAFSPDGKLLAAAEPRGKVHIVRTSDWQPVKELEAEPGRSALVAFSPDGRTLAATAGGSKVSFWGVQGWQALPPLAISRLGANSMQFSPDGKLLATGGDDEEVHIWRLSDGARLQRLRGHTKEVTTLAFSPDGQSIAAGSYDGTLRRWRVSDGKLLDTWDVTPTALIFISGGDRLLEGDLSTDPNLLRVSDGAPLARRASNPMWDPMSPKAESLALSPDGKTLAGGTGYGEIWLWNVGTMLTTP